MAEAHPERRRRHIYGRRKGPKLRPHQAALIETLLPKLALSIEQGHDPRSYFSNPVRDVWFEIGFGAGEHLVELARTHRDVGLIGAEPFVNGVAKLLSRIDSHISSLSPSGGEGQGEGAPATNSASPPHLNPLPHGGRGRVPPNIRIHMGDARDILEALPDACLGRVMILFPDPWPKTRHHKRRFIQMESLDALARVMKPGAELRFATDDPGYLAWALERLIAHPAFAWTARRADDWRKRPADWPATRYERKAIRGVPAYFTFIRR